MTSAVDWPRRRRNLVDGFWRGWRPSSLPRLCWLRKLIAEKYDGSSFRTMGRRKTRREIAALVVQMAEENRAWGYRRLQGALANLGHFLAHNTIADILKRNGIDPAPERVRK